MKLNEISIRLLHGYSPKTKEEHKLIKSMLKEGKIEKIDTNYFRYKQEEIEKINEHGKSI